MKFKVGTKEYEIKDADIAKAIEDKTSVLTLVEDVIVRSNAEETIFVENMKKDARKEGVEIAVKKYREANGLEFEGKTIEKLIEKVSAKVLEDAKLSPDEAVKAVNEKLKAKEAALKVVTQRAETAETTLKTTQRDYKIDNLLNQYLPKTLLLPVEDTKLLLRSKLGFEEDENGNITVKDLVKGEIMKKTETGDALPVKDAIEDFFRTNTQYVSKSNGGRGGDDSKTDENGKLTIEKFNENMKEKGYAINSSEYTEELGKAVAAKEIDID